MIPTNLFYLDTLPKNRNGKINKKELFNIWKNLQMKRKKLIIFGTGGGSNTAFRYFSRDTDREIVAFTQSKEYIKGDSLMIYL